MSGTTKQRLSLLCLNLKKTGCYREYMFKVAETGQGEHPLCGANGARIALTEEMGRLILAYGIRVNAVVVAECWTPSMNGGSNSNPVQRKISCDQFKNTTG